MAGRILVLDDEENYAEMLQDLLRGNNYCVDMATRPERAIDQLEEIPYDLVISDYKMPVMDGADFLKRARELYPNLPFILVSGLMNTPELVKVANMSVTLVMEKPLDTSAFLEQVARFSKPMTDEEKTAQTKEPEESDSDIGEVVASSYPEEPRFFSAVSATGKRFMQNAWSIVQTSKDLFILEPLGGDAELGAKDISVWRGNGDLPVASFVMPESNEAAILELRRIFSELEQSNTVCIRLTAASQIAQAHELTESAIKEVEGAANMLLIYVLESNEAASYLEQVGPRGIVLPKLNERASDVAAYARRFARIASDRSGKQNCSEFTPEAAFLIFAHNWPRGYKEVQEAVMQAVQSTEDDELISAKLLQEALGIEAVQVPSPDSRLLALMSKAQRCYFEKEMSVRGVSAAELGRKLKLGDAVQTRDELMNLPLVKSDLGKL